MENIKLEVESSTDGSSRRQMVTLEWYNYGVLVCYSLVESNFFSRERNRFWGEEGMEQLRGK